MMLVLAVMGLSACSDGAQPLGDVGLADAGPEPETDAGEPAVDAGVHCLDLRDEVSCSAATGVCKPHVCYPCGERFYAGCYSEDDSFPVCPTIECDGGV